MANRLSELLEELRLVLTGRGFLLDALLPPAIFLILNALVDLPLAAGGALAAAVLVAGYRLLRDQSLLYALGGIGGVALAAGIAWLLGRAEGFFLPGILSSALTALGCLLTVAIKRPLVAWTSFLTRRWPLDWYWHPQVRPAYSEVTLAWALFFGFKVWLQWYLFQNEAVGQLAVVQFLGGWPALVLLLVATYLYGLWRLQNLGGPSVEEHKTGAPPPWQSQRRGF